MQRAWRFARAARQIKPICNDERPPAPWLPAWRRRSTASRVRTPSASPQNCACSARIARHAVRIDRSAAASHVWPQCV
ncbi:hypothetical protein CDO09_03500 [Xanthomonas perforans]|nr:hypothetical protein CDO09_03500 [Xanthomonas perforans]